MSSSDRTQYCRCYCVRKLRWVFPAVMPAAQAMSETLGFPCVTSPHPLATGFSPTWVFALVWVPASSLRFLLVAVQRPGEDRRTTGPTHIACAMGADRHLRWPSRSSSLSCPQATTLGAGANLYVYRHIESYVAHKPRMTASTTNWKPPSLGRHLLQLGPQYTGQHWHPTTSVRVSRALVPV